MGYNYRAKELEETYNNLIVEQEEMNEQAVRELERNKAIDKNAAANQEALNAFDRGEFFRFDLEVDGNSDNWTLTISYGEDFLDKINSYETDDINSKVKDILNEAEFSDDDTFLCMLNYDGDQFGTARAVRKINDAFEDLQREYSGFYFTNSYKAR